jgi:hypothetical protein
MCTVTMLFSVSRGNFRQTQKKNHALLLPPPSRCEICVPRNKLGLAHRK